MSDPHNHSGKTILVVLICLTVLILLSCIFYLVVLNESLLKSEDEISTELNSSIYMAQMTPGERTWIEGNTEIKLPASAREIYAVSSGLNEVDTWLWFRLPMADLPVFIEDTHCEALHPTTEPLYQSSGANAPTWWQPQTAEKLLECSGGATDFAQYVLVDASDPEEVKVFVSGSSGNYRDTHLTPEP